MTQQALHSSKRKQEHEPGAHLMARFRKVRIMHVHKNVEVGGKIAAAAAANGIAAPQRRQLGAGDGAVAAVMMVVVVVAMVVVAVVVVHVHQDGVRVRVLQAPQLAQQLPLQTAHKHAGQHGHRAAIDTVHAMTCNE
jgi:hypothetical protein